ncbi:hypothetical protein Syun_002865 [Stephania yunnanensis]|uniref:DYW domain-containing protein n=1 Tax=Stephania yunnanensis TaxID=152371 RepID=A0AAP0PZM7_9MAGN
MQQWTRSRRAHNFLPSRPLTNTTPRDTRTESDILHTVRTLCARDHLQNALSLFYAASPTCDSQTYATLLHTCARLRRLSDGQTLHNHRHHHHRHNLFATNHLINMYAKCGSLDSARKVFDEMSQRNIVSWTILISGYDQHGHNEECFSLFSSMVSHCAPNEFAFASVISSSCGSPKRGRQVHAMALKAGFGGRVYVGNALITMYVKSRTNSSSDDALSMFENMPAKNLVTWNSMIAGFLHCGHVGKCIEFFSKMHREGVGFDRSALVTVAACLCNNNINNSSDDEHFYYCCQLHCLAVKTGLALEVEVATALVKAYAIVGGELDDCYKIFAETGSEQDIVSWTALITAFAERKQEEALLLFRQLRLQENNIDLDCYTFSIAIKASAGLPTENTASAIHALVIKYGFEGDVALDNALIHAYARCGSIHLSVQVFDCMRARDVVSWNSVFKACSVHGRGREALELFARMNVQPDAATFVALLSACSHSGLVEEGIKIFDSMHAVYGVIPQCDHYACMIDILGRVGRLAEAETMINRMPMQPDSVVWSALLGACRKHGETKMAELASKKLMELDPKNSLSYVSISNAYCSKGVFDEAAHVRKKMRKFEVRKEPGLSWIEIGNKVHEFAAGGRRHVQRDAVYSKLEWLIGKLKDMGYAPERSVDLHDIEEEQKEQQLYYHSEKLALAFALTNADTYFNGAKALRIMKNIRICVDCHNFMKIASEFVQREIIVRDANRFHHFKGGMCSCKDYW